MTPKSWTAIVLGCGCIGLMTIMALKACGVSEIYAVDVMEKRLERAAEVGAARVFNGKEEDIVEFANNLPGGGVNQVYECAGNRFTILQSCKLIKIRYTATGTCIHKQLQLYRQV